MKETRLEKGITLIALIITIVVLLILAVVSIGAIRNSSIITHAQNAKNSWKKGQTQEELELKIAELKIDMTQNPDNYKCMVGEDDNGNATDNGKVNGIFESIGLIINSSYLTEDGRIIFYNEKLINEGANKYSYDIKCKDKNNKDIIATITLQLYDDNTYVEITQIRLNGGELSNTIYELNEKIQNNPNDYRSSGVSNDSYINTLKLIYEAMVNEGITIESQELINSEKNNFDYDVLFDGENPKVELVSSTKMRFDCVCSKGGETLTIVVIFGPVSYSLEEKYVRTLGMSVK